MRKSLFDAGVRTHLMVRRGIIPGKSQSSGGSGGGGGDQSSGKKGIDDSKLFQALDTHGHHSEGSSGSERIQNYGFSSVPLEAKQQQQSGGVGGAGGGGAGGGGKTKAA